MHPRSILVCVAATLSACGGATPAATDTASDEAAPALALPNQQEPEPGLYSGGQPTEDDLRAAAAAGVRLVISLRTADEAGHEAEAAQVEELGMRFESIPVAGAEGVTVENARRLDELLAGREGATIVHCASGNRVGALLAVRAFLAGSEVEEALRLGRAAGLTRLEDAVRERLIQTCAEDPERTCE